MQYSLIALAIGFLLDLVFGDPHSLWHPVRGIGMLITVMEKLLRKAFPGTKKGELVAGVILVLAVVILSAGIPAALLVLVFRWNVYAGILLEAIMCYQLLATKSLKVESMKVYDALKAGDLEGGRRAVSMIVGRDTESLTQEGIIKAAVETVAENTSDGSIAPIFYMAIGGPVLGFFYKAVNTMDSMVGYKNDKYLYFGRAAAKLDDVLNYLPARLSAYLMIGAAAVRGLPAKKAWRVYLRDRFNHASPNSAHTEAVTAGALEIQLAGDAYYFGKLYQKKTIGDNIRPATVADIKRANELLYYTAMLGLLFCGGIKLLVLFFIL
ncbi:MAG TPA: cobalamin biosynthesis protein CobD [Clostridiales bacterium]|nr:cobalamin biosynthesis protein CobD [Clostridiales bacterium]